MSRKRIEHVHAHKTHTNMPKYTLYTTVMWCATNQLIPLSYPPSTSLTLKCPQQIFSNGKQAIHLEEEIKVAVNEDRFKTLRLSTQEGSAMLEWRVLAANQKREGNRDRDGEAGRWNGRRNPGSGMEGREYRLNGRSVLNHFTLSLFFSAWLRSNSTHSPSSPSYSVVFLLFSFFCASHGSFMLILGLGGKATICLCHKISVLWFKQELEGLYIRSGQKLSRFLSYRT